MSTSSRIFHKIKSLFRMSQSGLDSKIDFNAPLDETQLEGKRVLITGGASGIGAGCARLFVTHGAHVIIADMNEELGMTVVKELEGLKGTYVFSPIFLTYPQHPLLYFYQ